MKIAVTYENGEVYQDFGHTEQFKLYEVSGGKLLHAQVVDTNGSGHGALAGLLAQLGVDTLILYVGVDWLRWHDLVVKILSNVVVIILNYFISKLLVFRKKR